MLPFGVDTCCLCCSEIEIPQADPDGDPPTTWWDEEADKSLLIGVYKHGNLNFPINLYKLVGSFEIQSMYFIYMWL